MSTQAIEISKPGEGKLTVTSEQMTLARQTVAKDLDESQFALFCYNCQRLGVHPLDGLLVPIVRNDQGEKRLTFVNTVDLLRSRAAETGDYAGSDDATFAYELKDSQYPSDAHVTVWKFVQGEKCSFSATARWEEYYPGDKQGFMWRNKPHVMLGKCAEALALRKAFPKQLSGLYISEELQREIESTGAPARGKQQQAGKQAPKPVGDVVCADCGKKNTHDPSCKYAQACPECHAPAGKPHATGCARKTDTAPSTAAQGSESKAESSETPKEQKWLVEVVAVDQREKEIEDKFKKKVKKPFLIVTAFNAANENVTLYCWHTGETRTRLLAVKPKTRCIFMVKGSVQGTATYYSIESIVEITGEERQPEQEMLPPE